MSCIRPTKFAHVVYRTRSEDANAFINAHFSANPVGVEYDPEDWLARLRAGAPVSDFLVRQVHEPVSPVRGSIAT
ncbi:MAG TPA: hypothetical protein VK747_23785 [Blastocatellia bacterium]|nr:hypothetical protein [Blastocatellia bacterium]